MLHNEQLQNSLAYNNKHLFIFSLIGLQIGQPLADFSGPGRIDLGLAPHAGWTV